MSSINITREQWPDLVIAFLLDKMIKGDDILGENEEFNELIKLMEKRGMKPIFLHYYLSSDSILRSKYKMLSKSLQTGKSESATIRVDAGKPTKKDKEKEGTIKSLIKKALKLVVAHKKRSGFPLSEDKVDKILDKLLIEEGIKEKEL